VRRTARARRPPEGRDVAFARALPGPRERAARGFTLIELMAVLVIFGLLAGIALPNLGLRDARALDDEAKQLANGLEFARARAVMTAVPHRVLLDLDASGWRIEALATAEDGVSLDAALAEAAGSPEDPAAVALAPPGEAEREFLPLPGTLGDDEALDERVAFAAVETPEGVFEAGVLQIVFERDGTSEPAWIALSNESGRRVVLEVAPLADTVRFLHDAAR